MISMEIFYAFFATSVLLALTPGPDNIFVLTQAAMRGKRAGIVIMLGLCSGLIVHTLAVALGVAVIFQTSQMAFNILKYVGAAYLVYLAYGAFKASAMQPEASSEGEATKKGNLYLRGVIMNITNPKVSIFFLAFLPQFVHAQNGAVTTQMIQLGLVFMLATFIVFGGLALAAGSIGDKVVSSERGQKIMNRLAGCIFGALAVKLALSER